MRDKHKGVGRIWEIPEHFHSGRRYTDDTRSRRRSGDQLCVGFSRN